MLFLFLLALVVLFFAAANEQELLPQSWQWEKLFMYIAFEDADGWHMGLLLRGLVNTLRLGLWAGFVALVIGVSSGMFLAGNPCTVYAGILSTCFIFLRNTPPLVLLFLLYFVTSAQLFSDIGTWSRAAPLWVQDVLRVGFATPDVMDRMLAAVLTLGCYQGAYVSEIIRAGIQGLPRSQWDAGSALGFSRRQCLFLVLLPQSLPLILPPLAGQCISIFKESALASLISVPELTFQGMEVMAISRLPFEAWILVACLYFCISFVCTRFFGYMEKRLSWHAEKTP